LQQQHQFITSDEKSEGKKLNCNAISPVASLALSAVLKFFFKFLLARKLLVFGNFPENLLRGMCLERNVCENMHENVS
jgi:hypothetical protein